MYVKSLLISKELRIFWCNFAGLSFMKTKLIVPSPMKTLLSLLFFCFAISVSAQQKSEPASDQKLYTQVEKMPAYPGGEEALMQYMLENLNLPETALNDTISGTSYIGFIVTKQGQVEQVHVIKSFREDCDQEAVRVIKAMPAWKPGIQDGKQVNVQYTLPIRFTLSTSKQK